MRQLHLVSLSLLALSASSPLVGSGEPAAPQCAFEIRLSDHTLSATSSQGCQWARLSATCTPDKPCAFHVTSNGVGEPVAAGLPGIIVRPDPDGVHARYECLAAACSVSSSAGEGRSEAKHLAAQESALGLAAGRVVITLPSK
jgi:hypothetical protein